MGCDIHIHTEAKLNGRWEHIGNPEIGRNYALFEKLAGVRGDTENAISPPKGLPKDLSYVTQYDADKWGTDGHSHSWISGNEIDDLEKWWAVNMAGRDYPLSHMEGALGYLFGNGWNVSKYPKDYPDISDTRFVFWFDN